MKLKIFALAEHPPKIARANRARRWMDEFPGRHPYRCLPLAIANSYGWDVLSPYAFTATWNGGPGAQDVTFEAHGHAPYLSHFVNGNFTHGVVTLHTGYLFRTEPGWHLVATGPPNTPKDGVVPLTGIIESDWLPYPFTMNWQFTRPGSVRFDEGEPFCRVFPVPAGAVEGSEPEVHDLTHDPELYRQYQVWRETRDEFMAKYRSGDAATIKQAWQKLYFEGKYADGAETNASHTAKLRAPEPQESAFEVEEGRALVVEEPDYEIVASTENTPYLLWQALLFHASCVRTQGVAPTFVVHGDEPLLPGFRALGELGARIVTAPSYRMSDGVEYTCRNTAGSLVEVTHERPWTLLCDPDFLFLEPLPKRAASMSEGCAASWDFVSYMQVGDFNRRWLEDACRERGIDPARLDGVRAGGVVPNLVRADVRRELAERWVSAVDTLVRVARRDGDVPWVTIAWGFALAAWELGHDVALTHLTHTTHGGANARAESLTSPILHYCYGDEIFDKRRHRGADSAPLVWTLEGSGASVSALFVEHARAAREWYREHGIDVTNPRLYLASDAPRTTLAVANPPHARTYLDALPLRESAVGFGSLGLHGSLGY